MIDRRATLACAALVALMLVLAVWRIITLDDRTTLAIQDGAPLPALLLLAFPAASALVVAALWWNGRGAAADEAKTRAWRTWGTSLAIAYCVGLLLMLGLVIVRSLGLDVAVDLSALARTGGIALALMSLLAINQMPKLPWVERAFGPGAELGPIYGPRYVRLHSRVVVVFMIAVIVWSLSVPPPVAWRSALYILLACALLVVWSLSTRRHLSRKWKREQLAARGLTPP
jgi:hypothetical protein